MQVLAVTAWPPWDVQDGGSLIIRHHLEQLAGRHRITLLSASRRGDTGGAPQGVQQTVYTMGVPAGVDYGLRRLRSLVSREPLHVHWVERRALRSALRRHIRRESVDLLYLFGWGTAQLWREAGPVPTVHHAVDPWAGNTGNRLLPRWRRLLEPGAERTVAAHEARHYPHIGRVVVVAPEDARALACRIPGACMRVVRNGVDPGPEPAMLPDEPVLAFHGSLCVEANVRAAIALATELLPAVQARVPDARALVIGRDPPSAIRELAGPSVTVTGRVDAVRPWLEQAAVYVAPMVSGAGIKNKVLEAMAAGRPVVATTLGLQAIGPGYGVFEAPDVPSMVERVIRLLEDGAARVDAGRAARARVLAEFTWHHSAEALEEVWREAVGDAASVPEP